MPPPEPQQPANPPEPSPRTTAAGATLPFKAQVRRWPRLPAASAAMRKLEESIARVAEFECPALITGETGCGKEEIARAVHAAGPRSDKPFVTVNCGGVVAALAESQLFGHEKGAFTGASGSSRGVFRAADGGTVLLDEIGELPLELQPKLLRVLQRGEVTPVGSTETFHVDVVVLAATNRDLDAQVAAGVFREDLLYRLNTVHLQVPPLRARPEDIPRFIEHFSNHFSRLYDLPRWQPDLDTLSRIIGHAWPGNVRQLAQTIQRIYVFHDRVGEVLDDLFGRPPASAFSASAPVLASSVPVVTAATPVLPAPVTAVTAPVPPVAAAAPAGAALVPAVASPRPPVSSVAPPAAVAASAVAAGPSAFGGPIPLAAHRGLATAPPIPGLTVAEQPLEPVPADEQVPSFNLDELRRMAVRQALVVTGGHRGRAAQLLGVSPNRMSRLVAEACPDAVARTGRRRGGIRKPR